MKKIVFIGLMCIALCACGNRSSVAIPVNVFDKMVDVLMENNEFENERSRIRHYQLLEDLDKPAKAKLGSVVLALQKLERNRLAFDSLVTLEIGEEWQDQDGVIPPGKLTSVDEFIREKHAELYTMTQSLVEENAGVFGFREDQKVTFIESLLSQSNTFIKEKYPKTQEIYRQTKQGRISLLLLQADFFASQQIFEEALTLLAYSSGGCWIDAVFPMVFVANGCLNSGDTLQAKIGIGAYSSLVFPEHTLIVVNADTLMIDDSGVATFEKIVTNADSQILDVECVVSNPYTGVSVGGEGQFIFPIN